MTNTFEFAPDAYQYVSNTIWTAFVPERGFPELVLRNRGGHIAFFEFEELFQEDIWRTVRRLALRLGDNEICGLVIRPDPITYYHALFGHYGAVRLQVPDLEMKAPAILAWEPPASPADALVHNAEVLAFSTPSLGVAMWAERELGVGMMQVPTGLAPELRDTHSAIRWHTVDNAVRLMAPSFAQEKIPAGFTRTFVANYATPPV